ncbi:glycosyltransferase family 2 protein [Acetobacter indonesiensis]|uniref:glycosyltransferase family 2 protein n=1 Tax=Acetobacter indonesiensis TaxID=104101 RepID=UPI0020A3B0F4|nr:glycosyltransferase family 2 protein [Acetobacter indonesiensis]MCP1230428.1 glycosyltransferase family 2 protein [Acetobacter indonesiensis]
MKTAICLCVKNEEKELVYWLAWHTVIGFDSFIIYDDCSSDKTVSVIQSLSEKYDIRLLRNFENKDRSVIRQCRCYNDAVARYKDEFDWIAFFDSDEYLDLYGKKIADYLSDKSDVDCIAFNWCCFGSNGHIERPFGPPIFVYTKHGEQNAMWNRHTKVMIRPRKIKKPIYQVHNILVKGKTILSNGQIPNWTNEHGGFVSDDANWEQARLLHFQSRSIEHYVNKNKYIDDVRKRKNDPLQVITKGTDYDTVLFEINENYIREFIVELGRLSEAQKTLFIRNLKNENSLYFDYLKNKFKQVDCDIFKPNRDIAEHDISNGWISFHEHPGSALESFFKDTGEDYILFTMKNNFGDFLGVHNNKLCTSKNQDVDLVALYIKGSSFIHFMDKNMKYIYIDGDFVVSRFLTYKIWNNKNGSFSISNFKNGRYLGFTPNGDYVFSKLRALSWEQIYVNKITRGDDTIRKLVDVMRDCGTIEFIYRKINNHYVNILFFNLLKIIDDPSFSAISFICNDIINEHLV